MDTARQGWTRWLLWLTALALAGWLVLHLVAPAPAPGPVATPAPVVEPTATTAAAPADLLVVGGVDVGASVSSALAGISASFSGITDPDSAQSALPHLIEARDRLTGLEGPVSSLSETGRASLRDMIDATMPAIRDAAERLKTDGPIAAVVSPVVDDILAQLSAYAA